jgi:hypothetical protein
MAPPSLHGLNIVHPPPQAADSQDLIGQPYLDLASQLDLWSNLTFDSDEGYIVARADDDNSGTKHADDDERTGSPSLGTTTTEAAIRAGHVNVVTGTNLGTNQTALDRLRRAQQQQNQQPPFDINSLLAGFGIDPVAAPSHSAVITPSLAQLLALQNAGIVHSPPPTQDSTASPIAVPVQQQQQQPKAAEKLPAHASSISTDESHPATKKPRSRRASEVLAGASAEAVLVPEKAVVLAAEDKRRRNTAARARFRLKKKEREAALEGKAKELEMKVNELERECEALRRENGWLKGLVIGVTGVAQTPAGNPAPLPLTTTSLKRTRDERESP